MQAAVGSARVPLSGSGSAPSLLALCWRTLTTITRITIPTATTATIHPPRLTIRLRRTIRPHGAVGAPITITITLVEWQAHTGAGGLSCRFATVYVASSPQPLRAALA